jgi:hypothetical protein
MLFNIFTKYPALAATITTIGISLVVFFSFAVAGWPGKPGGCRNDFTSSGCFCERPRHANFWIAQPANTWSNLSFPFVALIIAYCIDTGMFVSGSDLDADTTIQLTR